MIIIASWFKASRSLKNRIYYFTGFSQLSKFFKTIGLKLWIKTFSRKGSSFDN